MEVIQKVIEEYFKSWNDGFKSKDGDGIRLFMSENFVGYWAHSNLDQPDRYDYNYDLNSVLEQYMVEVRPYESFVIAFERGK